MNIEKEFTPFADALKALGYLLHESEIGAFKHFLEYVIAQHSHTVVKDLKSATKAIKIAYFEVYKAYVKLQDLKINTQHKEWFDPFGTYFELYSSRMGKRSKGQFFTPENLCDCMTQMMITKDMEKERISDPSCGSGRLLLSSHAYNPKNFHFGQDIDYTCCLMTSVNMMMHGIQGEVVHGDALLCDSYFQGWAINPNIRQLRGIPHIENLVKENSFIYHVAQSRKLEILEKKQETEKASIEKLKNADFLNMGENKISINKSKDEKTTFDFF